jgi:hypothetical protein
VSNYPHSWAQYCTLVRDSKGELPIEFIDHLGDLSRWSARFRLARSFRSLDLGDEYSDSETPQLYSSITRIFLVYSAFEAYCGILGLRAGQELEVKKMQDDCAQERIVQRIRDLDSGNQIAKFLMPHLNARLGSKIQDFIDGREVNVSFLAKCIRHIFAHGILAAHSSELSAKKFEEISQVISDFLLTCMDKDFDGHVEMIVNKSSC